MYSLIVMIALIVFFYRAADFEDLPMPIAWGGASCVLFLAAANGLRWGVCGAMSGQLLLFIAMTVCVARSRGAAGFSLNELKSQWRLTRGRCPQCGYDLQGTQRPGRCPECGAHVPADHRVA